MTRLIGKDCIFCGNRPVTKEHIWPDWIVKEFKPFTKRTGKKVTGVFTSDGQVLREWPTNSITIKRRLVCDPCNSRWMSDIETSVRRDLATLIHHAAHGSCLITGELQRRLSAWMMLRAFVFDAIAPPPKEPSFSDEERSGFRANSREPLPDTRIWLAAFAGEPYRAMFAVRSHVLISEPGSFHVYSAVMNEIVLQLHISKGAKRADINQDQWTQVVRQIWPVAGPAIWPPDRAMGEGVFYPHFARRFYPLD